MNFVRECFLVNILVFNVLTLQKHIITIFFSVIVVTYEYRFKKYTSNLPLERNLQPV